MDLPFKEIFAASAAQAAGWIAGAFAASAIIGGTAGAAGLLIQKGQIKKLEKAAKKAAESDS